MSSVSVSQGRRARGRATRSSDAVVSPKRAVNLSLSADVLDEARRLGFNLSQMCDAHLREQVRREHERRWRAEHATFFSAYNTLVEAEGLPLQDWQGF